MTWNESQQQTGPAIGWHWYCDTTTSQLRPVKVFDVAGLKYAWPMGTDPEHPLTVRVEQCTGEFVGPLQESMSQRLSKEGGH